MLNNGDFIYLDEGELMLFFSDIALEDTPDLVYYEVCDKYGIKLKFSFSIIQKSIQTVININGMDLVENVYEGDGRMYISNDTLYFQSENDLKETRMRISIKEGINVKWSTVIT